MLEITVTCLDTEIVCCTLSFVCSVCVAESSVTVGAPLLNMKMCHAVLAYGRGALMLGGLLLPTIWDKHRKTLGDP